MQFLPKVLNRNEWVFDLSAISFTFKKALHADMHVLMYSLINALLMIHHIENVILDEVSTESYEYMLPSCKNATSLIMTAQQINQISELNSTFDRRFEKCIFRTNISERDAIYYHLSSLKDKIPRLNVGEYLQIS